jgi:hypothetical protein
MPNSTKRNTQPIRKRPKIGASVWYGAEIAASDDWTRTFTLAGIAEIEAAVEASRALPIPEIGKADFPLPTLGAVFDDLRRELIDGRGFVHLRGLPVESWPRETAARAYWGLGVHVGLPVSQNPEGHLLGHVKDIGGDFDDLNSRGGYRSRARLPFHTDVGADIVGLLCLRPAGTGGHSSIASVAAIYNAMLAQRPDLVEELSRPICRDRRGEIPPTRRPSIARPCSACTKAG